MAPWKSLHPNCTEFKLGWRSSRAACGKADLGSSVKGTEQGHQGGRDRGREERSRKV